MSPRCDRTVLVEALFDGRLGASEERSLARHLGACPECTARQDELEALRADVRDLAVPITPLEHQRARLVLLRAAAAPPRARRPKRFALLVAAVVFIPVVVWAARGALIASSPAPIAPPSAPSVSSVVVAPPSPIAPSEPTPEAPPASSVSAAPRTAQGTSATAARSRASRDFADAMESVSRGDFGAGAAQLDRFARDYPQDPRAEEALYLQAIALERAGRAAEAKTVARRYLAKYPEGAHEAQARRLADVVSE